MAGVVGVVGEVALGAAAVGAAAVGAGLVTGAAGLASAVAVAFVSGFFFCWPGCGQNGITNRPFLSMKHGSAVGLAFNSCE